MIVDYTDVTDVPLSADAVRAVSQMPPTVSADVWLIGVAPKPVMYGLVRVFELMASETRPNLQVVHTMQAEVRAPEGSCVVLPSTSNCFARIVA